MDEMERDMREDFAVPQPEMPAEQQIVEPDGLGEDAPPRIEIRQTTPLDDRSLRNKLIGAVCGVGLGVLLLTVGFWKTLLLGGMGALGAFLFGVNDKQQSVKTLINRLFPPKD
jgi:uncharacterized membrane protein